jgi:hypothetical protein
MEENLTCKIVSLIRETSSSLNHEMSSINGSISSISREISSLNKNTRVILTALNLKSKEDE